MVLKPNDVSAMMMAMAVGGSVAGNTGTGGASSTAAISPLKAQAPSELTGPDPSEEPAGCPIAAPCPVQIVKVAPWSNPGIMPAGTRIRTASAAKIIAAAKHHRVRNMDRNDVTSAGYRDVRSKSMRFYASDHLGDNSSCSLPAHRRDCFRRHRIVAAFRNCDPPRDCASLHRAAAYRRRAPRRSHPNRTSH